jgi:hypothetical protein
MSWKLKSSTTICLCLVFLFFFYVCVFQIPEAQYKNCCIKNMCAHKHIGSFLFFKFSLTFFKMSPLAHQILSLYIVNNFFFCSFRNSFFFFSFLPYRVLSLPCSSPRHFVLFKEEKSISV